MTNEKKIVVIGDAGPMVLRDEAARHMQATAKKEILNSLDNVELTRTARTAGLQNKKGLH